MHVPLSCCAQSQHPERYPFIDLRSGGHIGGLINAAALMAEGKSLEAIQAARPTADFDARADADGFIKPDRLVGFIVESLGSRQGLTRNP